MKPGNGLRRKSRLQAKTGLKRGAQVPRRTPLRAVPKAEAKAAPKRKTVRDTGPSPLTRETVKNRDLGRCVRCGRAIGDGPRSIHHRKRRSQGGTNDAENLILLDGTGTTGCHGWVHAHPAEARAAGWLLLESQDPAAERVMVATGPGVFAWFLLSDDGERYGCEPDGAVSAA